jgi:hypothetical protein
MPLPARAPAAPSGAAVPGDALASATPLAVPALSDETVLAGLVRTRQARQSMPARGAGAQDWKTAVAEAIAAGRTTRKSQGPEGLEKVLAPAHEKAIETLLAHGEPQLVRRMGAHLQGIGGPAAPLARALYLKASAARAAALTGSDPARREAALATLEAFAGRLDGMSAEELLRRSSVIDLDSRVSTSAFEPLTLESRRGAFREIGRDDARTDNDGLIQRFSGSCGPTSLQIALCEADPVRAFVVHDAGLDAAVPDDISGRFQAELLGRYASAARSRLAARNRARVQAGVKQLQEQGKLEPDEAKALIGFVKGGSTAPATPGVRRALTELRALAGGFPGEREIEQMRADPPRGEGGLAFDEFEGLINHVLSPLTGQTYRQTEPKDGLQPGEAVKHLDAVAAALRRGLDVPFGLSEAEHWMLLTAVEGREPKRRFLVADPFTGRTGWVPEERLVSGDFSADPFELVGRGVKDHIDSFFLPQPAGPRPA